MQAYNTNGGADGHRAVVRSRRSPSTRWPSEGQSDGHIPRRNLSSGSLCSAAINTSPCHKVLANRLPWEFRALARKWHRWLKVGGLVQQRGGHMALWLWKVPRPEVRRLRGKGVPFSANDHDQAEGRLSSRA